MKNKHKRFLTRLAAFTLTACLSVGLFAGLPVGAEDMEQAQPVGTVNEEPWLPDEALEQAAAGTLGDLTPEELATAVLAAEDIPEVISREEIAERGHVNRLWEQEQDLNTVVFQNRDGTKTMYYFGEAVKYVDEDGVVRDKKNTLDEVGDSALLSAADSLEFAADYQYVNSANDVKTYFPRTLEKSTGIVTEYGELRLELRPDYVSGLLNPAEKWEVTAENIAEPAAASSETDNVKIIHSMPAVADKTQVADSVASDKATDAVEYEGVFGAGTTLRYTPSFSGFKEDIVLEENLGINEFRFILETNGLSLVTEEETYYLADPLTGDRVAQLDNILVFDSSVPDEPDADEEIRAWQHEYRVETLEQDQRYSVTLVVDAGYLNDPSTVYPVTIDPSLTFTGTSGGIQDATIYDKYKVNDGGSGSLYVGNYTARHGGSRGIARTLVKFPIKGTLASVNYTQIQSAKLYFRDILCESDTVGIRCHEVTSGWSENTVKCSSSIWNAWGTMLDSKSVKYGNGENGIGGSTGGHWYGFNITDAVEGWLRGRGDNNGIMLMAAGETNPAKTFASANRSSNQPTLVVNYNAYTVPEDITDNGVYYFQNMCSGKYLDIQNNGTSNNTPLIQNGVTYAPSQRFKLVRDAATGYYRIQAQNTSVKRVLLLNTSNQVVLSDDCSNERALWRINSETGGQYSFINKSNETTKAYAMTNGNVGSAGAIIRGESYDNATRFRWQLKPIVSALTMNITDTVMQLGDTQSVSVSRTPSNAALTPINWSSTNEGIVQYSGGKLHAVGIGEATITATLSSDSTIKVSKTITVRDTLTEIYESLTREEYYYTFYPPGLGAIPLIQNVPTSPEISTWTLEQKLLSIPICRRYEADPPTSETDQKLYDMRDELNTITGINITLKTARQIQLDYHMAVYKNILGPGVYCPRYTPENIERAQNDYRDSLHTLVNLVVFKIADELNPFDAYGNIKFKADKERTFYDNNGNPIWPGTNGDVNTDGFVNGKRYSFTFETGDLVDRYGYESGNYLSPVGTPMSARALARGTTQKPYHIYKVLKPFDAEVGIVAPWFNQVGGGVQYKLMYSIEYYINAGYLMPV